jgi:DNA-directed RNA polymerase specialized sigma subunit, sigma24 homolog
MASKFEEEFIGFSTDGSAQYGVLRLLIKLTKNIKEAEDLLNETIAYLWIKNSKKTIELNNSIEGYIVAAARNKWIDKMRQAKKQVKSEEGFLFFNDEKILNTEEFEETKHKEIQQANESYILNNIEALITNDFERRIFIAHYQRGEKYNKIVEGLIHAGETKPDGKNYTANHLRQINYRTGIRVRKEIERQYPDFNTKLIY